MLGLPLNGFSNERGLDSGIIIGSVSYSRYIKLKLGRVDLGLSWVNPCTTSNGRSWIGGVLFDYLAESVDFVLAHISVKYQSRVLKWEAGTYSVVVGRNHGLQWNVLYASVGYTSPMDSDASCRTRPKLPYPLIMRSLKCNWNSHTATGHDLFLNTERLLEVNGQEIHLWVRRMFRMKFGGQTVFKAKGNGKTNT